MNGNATAMDMAAVNAVLAQVHGASRKGVEDGTRVHVHYKAFGVATATAIVEAKRASDLALASDRYTGRVNRVWEAHNGDRLVTLYVELERDHKYRTLNLSRGTVYQFVIMGN